jgi:hypothetical protein
VSCNSALVAALVFSLQIAQVAPQTLQKISTLSDLQPRTIEQNARAVYFDLSPIWGYPEVTKPGIYGPVIVVEQGGSPGERTTIDEERSAAVCGSDVVVVGRIVASTAFLNRSRNGLFTDYEINIDEWIVPRGGFGTSRRVIVSSQWGSVLLNGQLLSSHDRPLPVGWRGVFFAKRVNDNVGLVLDISPAEADYPVQVLSDDKLGHSNIKGDLNTLGALTTKLKETALACRRRF